MSSQDNKPPTPSQLPPTFHPKSCLNNSILNQSQKRKITGCSSIKTPDNKQVACENWIDVNDVNAANDDDQRSSNSNKFPNHKSNSNNLIGRISSPVIEFLFEKKQVIVLFSYFK
ncbi:hypothetical protein PSTT_11254 [Puccinia striiformis]|uniref:Uncharacterized protein n=1 Tax=Puccinia striiformis TaxID=27350 RepID=A0A2S4V0W8_9BASI|nr:hypothetical protein PSTT_11254 [Puccinia striiformis]